MSLSHDIVVRNFYMSKRQPNSKAGTTPNKFLWNYMSRSDAAEFLMPSSSLARTSSLLQLRSYNNALRVQLHNNISLHQGTSHLHRDLIRVYGKNGLSFGDKGLSYSSSLLRNQAHLYKHLYASGHSLYKAVLSFTDNYLIRHRVLPKNFRKSNRGDYFGHVDQLRLRDAISHGMLHLAHQGKFNNLTWTGVVQYDANHIHCHILAGDNTPLTRSRRIVSRHPLVDRGIMPKSERNSIRDGINGRLLELQPNLHYDAQTRLNLSNQNVDTDTLDLSKQSIDVQLQQLVGSLPSNRNLWRFTNHSKRMRYPNSLMLSFIKSLTYVYGRRLHYGLAVSSLSNYAKKLCVYDHLSLVQARPLLHKYMVHLRSALAQNVYDHLRYMKLYKSNASSYMTMMSMTPQQLNHSKLSHSRLGHVILRTKCYSLRRDKALNSITYYYNGTRQYSYYRHSGKAGSNSSNMNRYYVSQLLLRAKLIDKYRYLLRFSSNSDVHQLALFSSRRRHLMSYLDSHVGDKSSKYLDNVKIFDFVFDAFSAGLINSNQLSESTSDFEHDRMMAVPMLSVRRQHLTRQHFNDCKNLDLDLDYNYDHFSVGHKSMQGFYDSLDTQIDSLRSAYSFLHGSEQHSEQFRADVLRVKHMEDSVPRLVHSSSNAVRHVHTAPVEKSDNYQDISFLSNSSTDKVTDSLLDGLDHIDLNNYYNVNDNAKRLSVSLD